MGLSSLRAETMVTFFVSGAVPDKVSGSQQELSRYLRVRPWDFGRRTPGTLPECVFLTMGGAAGGMS